MKNKSKLIEEFRDLGSRHALSLKDVAYYEGYILDFDETSFEFSLGGPMAPDEPLTIKYDDLDLESLSFYDDAENCYKDAIWQESKNKWMVCKSK